MASQICFQKHEISCQTILGNFYFSSTLLSNVLVVVQNQTAASLFLWDIVLSLKYYFFFLFPESVSASIIKHQQERCLTHKGSDLSRKKYHHSLQNTFLFSKYLFSSGIPTETNMMPYIKKTRKHPYECLQPKINRQDTLSSCKINVHLKILWINPAFPFVSNFRLRKCPFLLFYVCANSPK